jgi:hypothetical protein
MRSIRRNAWWVTPVVLAACAVTLAAARAGASGGRGIDEIHEAGGMVGVVPGQAARFNVSNVAEGQCKAKLQLLGVQGNLVASRNVTIAADASASLRFEPSARTIVRPRFISVGGSCPLMMVSLEVLDVHSGRTIVLDPAVAPIG